MKTGLGLGISSKSAGLGQAIFANAKAYGDLVFFADSSSSSGYTLNGSNQVTVVKDKSSSALTGTFSGTTASVLGTLGTKSRPAFTFDASDDYYRFDNNLDWDGVDSLMVMVAADFDDVTTFRPLVSKKNRDSPFKGWAVQVQSGTLIVAALEVNSTNHLSKNCPITTGSHVVTIKVTGGTNVTMWVDGVEQTVTSVQSTLSSLSAVPEHFALGSMAHANNSSFTDFFDGRIGHAMIWKGSTVPTLTQKQTLETLLENHYGGIVPSGFLREDGTHSLREDGSLILRES